MDLHIDKMVKTQIEDRGIRDPRVLEAMRKVERHKFVSDKYLKEAYEDHPLPIDFGQTISQPYIVALMSELCETDGSQKALEIGTGSGYQTAILSLLVKEVYTVEIINALGKIAAQRLDELGYKNVHVKIGDGYRGWPEHAPYDIIILTASPPEVPESLLDQLDEGGVLVAPVGSYNQELLKIKKTGATYQKKIVTYVRFVPMVHSNEK